MLPPNRRAAVLEHGTPEVNRVGIGLGGKPFKNRQRPRCDDVIRVHEPDPTVLTLIAASGKTSISSSGCPSVFAMYSTGICMLRAECIAYG